MTSQNQQGDPAPHWEIDSIFPGGSGSEEYAAFTAQISRDLDTSGEALTHLPSSLSNGSCPDWAAWIGELQRIAEHIHLAEVYALCLVSQDVEDAKGAAIAAAGNVLKSRWEILLASLESFSIRQSDHDWEQLMTSGGMREIRFFLDEIRRIARAKMPEEQEKLTLELAVNGYHAWNLLYEKMAGDLRVEIEEKGEKKHISLGQNAARMSHPDRAVRRDAFRKLEDAWQSRAELAAMALNSQAGFRLSIYHRRKWDSPLHEPLLHCRMKQETLDAMWAAVADGGRTITEYITAKKRLLGIDRFCWYDQEAPTGRADRTFTFREAGDFIVQHLGSFSEEMAQFSRRVIDQRWVEAENRAGKRDGGWCSRVPIRKQARIFMTFANSYDSLSTLAHELGHAYHGFVLKDVPPFAQHYPMTLAETASIFNELRVADAALAATDHREEKLALLDQRLQSALAFFCNIRARYLFDCRFYEERKQGIVERQRLSEIMTGAQRDSFFGLLDEREGYHPLFWASKLHFFITDAPFYNFPYTFGFLFAKGVYDRALKEGTAFAPRYRALLADTGRMTTEDVARKHLGVDLTRREFWDSAVARATADVEPFVALCKA